MHATVTTTITTTIDLETFTPTHRVEIDVEEGLTTELGYAAAAGGAKGLLAGIPVGLGGTRREDDVKSDEAPEPGPAAREDENE